MESIHKVIQSTVRILQDPPESLHFTDFVFPGLIILAALELVNFFVQKSGHWMHSAQIPVRGKHLDDLSTKDLLFIGLNKLATVPFVYFLLRFVLQEPKVLVSLQEWTVFNGILSIPCLFILYDFFYTILHWALHIQAIYGYIHKHHHHQKAPSRANVDAVNVHPIEFFLGEYNHLFAVYLYTRVFQQEMHIVALPLFLTLGAIMAGWNHTRFDVRWKFGKGKWTLFDSKYHDVHHRIPQCNYGQYIMLWDHIFGTFRYVFYFMYKRRVSV